MDRIAKAVTDQWWLVVLRGAISIVFGITAWVWPGLTLYSLVVLFGAFTLVTGIMALMAASIQRDHGGSPWPFVLQGILGLLFGAVILLWPGVSALALLFVIASWAVIVGASELGTAIALRKTITNEWWLALAGIGSIAFGLVVAVFPGDGALALVWTIGSYAVGFGVLMVIAGLRMQGWQRDLQSVVTPMQKGG